MIVLYHLLKAEVRQHARELGVLPKIREIAVPHQLLKCRVLGKRLELAALENGSGRNGCLPGSGYVRGVHLAVAIDIALTDSALRLIGTHARVREIQEHSGGNDAAADQNRKSP